MDKLKEAYEFKKHVIKGVLDGSDLDDVVLEWVEEDITHDGLEDVVMKEVEDGWTFKFKFIDEENSSYSSGFDRDSGPWSELNEQAYIRKIIHINGNDISEEDDNDK